MIRAFQRADGGVTTTMFAPGVDPDEETVRLKAMGHIDVAWPHVDVAEADIPADQTFREAWTVANGKIDHDIVKARDIWRGILRDQRAPLLNALDVAVIRANETGDAAAVQTAVDQKQALRDITADPRIDAAATIDDLKKITLAQE